MCLSMEARSARYLHLLKGRIIIKNKKNNIIKNEDDCKLSFLFYTR